MPLITLKTLAFSECGEIVQLFRVHIFLKTVCVYSLQKANEIADLPCAFQAYFGILSADARWLRQVSKRRGMRELKKGGEERGIELFTVLMLLGPAESSAFHLFQLLFSFSPARKLVKLLNIFPTDAPLYALP